MTTDSYIKERFSILAAIWILACNDETPSITYRGIQQRLNLPQEYDLRGLISQHGELFRLRIPQSRLEQWKSDMRLGQHLPRWVREVTGPARVELINSLKPEDGFRSQFRAEPGAPPSDTVVIEWGLNHIERLRKAHSEAREASAKSWQMWLIFSVGILGFLAT